MQFRNFIKNNIFNVFCIYFFLSCSGIIFCGEASRLPSLKEGRSYHGTMDCGTLENNDDIGNNSMEEQIIFESEEECNDAPMLEKKTWGTIILNMIGSCASGSN